MAGHEGSGVVEAVGPAVQRVAVGDHVVLSFIPACGECKWCATGNQNLCDQGAMLMHGGRPDGTLRARQGEVEWGQMCCLGSFAERIVISQWSCVRIDSSIPLDVAALVGCGVPTGYGAAVNTAGVRAGDVVAVFGSGGVGINAVQGAALAGAAEVVVVDPVEYKRSFALQHGATHAFANAAEATEFVFSITNGQGADKSIVTPGTTDAGVVREAFDILTKNGVEVIVGQSAGAMAESVVLPGTLMSVYQKTVKGSLYGGCNPLADIPKLLALYRKGHIAIQELITNRYKLDEVAKGFADMHEGINIRGVLEINPE
jgi:NDMA-dependent alcohol dehydrogenase